MLVRSASVVVSLLGFEERRGGGWLIRAWPGRSIATSAALLLSCGLQLGICGLSAATNLRVRRVPRWVDRRRFGPSPPQPTSRISDSGDGLGGRVSILRGRGGVRRKECVKILSAIPEGVGKRGAKSFWNHSDESRDSKLSRKEIRAMAGLTARQGFEQRCRLLSRGHALRGRILSHFLSVMMLSDGILSPTSLRIIWRLGSGGSGR